MPLRKSPPEKEVRKAAEIVARALETLKLSTTEGVSLLELEKIAQEAIRAQGAVSYNKGYKPEWSQVPYPAVLCVSVNEEVAHGIPTDRKLKKWDLVTYDLGIKYKSACGDAAITVPVGEPLPRDARLLRYSMQCLQEGIKKVHDGVSIGELQRAMENYARLNGYSIVKDYAGHGIGFDMHEEPLIPHFYDINNPRQDILTEGQVICLEPILTPGNGVIYMKEDKWTTATIDRQKASMFEVMLLVTKEGSEILTPNLLIPYIS